MAFGPRCNPGTPSFIALLKWPPYPGCFWFKNGCTLTKALRIRASILDQTERDHLPTPQGRGLGSSGSCLRTGFECCCTSQHSGLGGNFGTPIQERVPRMQRGPKARPPRPKDSTFRRDRGLPSMDSADRQVRPLSAYPFTHSTGGSGIAE